jgi:hypothetical protein
MQTIKITTPNHVYLTETKDAKSYIIKLYHLWNENPGLSLTRVVYKSIEGEDTWLDDYANEIYNYMVVLTNLKLTVYQDAEVIFTSKIGCKPPFSVPVKTVTFLYEKDVYNDKRRLVEVQEENKTYIKGLDLDDHNKFKCFLKSKVVGDILEVKV